MLHILLIQKKIKKIGLSSLRIGINIVNPFTFTKYKGYDPEVSASTNAISRGVDMGNYPQARTYSLISIVHFNTQLQ